VKNTQDIGFSAFFLGIAFMRLFFLIANYYALSILISPFFLWSSGSFRFLFLNIGLISINLGVVLFTYFLERYKTLLYKKYFLTFCFLFQFILFFILSLVDLLMVNYLLIWLLPSLLILSIFYIKVFNKQVKMQIIHTKGWLYMGFSIILLLLGYFFSLDFILITLGAIARLIGTITPIIAIIIMFLLFRNIPPFFERDWQKKIEDIYLLFKNGINLFSKSYINSDKSIDEHTISGALSSVNIMLNELMHIKNNRISVIEKANKIVTIFSSEYVIGVLISSEALEFFKFNLKRLVLKIELIYKSVLVDWDGNRAKFSQLNSVVDDIFPI